MHSEQFYDHFGNPRNVGELPPPAVTVTAANPVCGDTLRLSVRWEDGRVAASAYKSRGCTAAIAAGSALTELIRGKSRDELRSIRATDVEAALGGLPTASRHAAALCADAIKLLLLNTP